MSDKQSVREQLMVLSQKYSKRQAENIVDETKYLEDLRYDSMGFLSFIVEVEQSFGIEVDDEYLNLKTINFKRLYDHILEKLG